MSTTSLMSLELSTPGVTNDLVAATNDQANWEVVDVHDHSSGKGAQVPTSGININSALNFAGQKAYNFLATQFSNQTGSLATAANKPCIYVLNGELRFIDNSGNDVLMTNSGSVAGTSGSISGLTAPVAAGFSSATFAWQADSGTGLYAKMSNADINLYEATAGVTNAVTLKSYPSLAASYSITMPAAVPASTEYVAMANTGALSTVTADTIGTGMTATGANVIAAARTRSTGTSVAAGGIAISTSSGAFLSTSTSYVDVTNLTVTIVTSGRPVFVGLIIDPSALTASGIGIVANSNTLAAAAFKILRDATLVGETRVDITAGGNGTNLLANLVPVGSLSSVDAVGAGTYVYKVQAKVLNSTGAGSVSVSSNYAKLVAYEL